jgi:uncharacterized protein (TIGR02599 family)
MRIIHGYHNETKRSAFTLVELMVSTALIAVLMLLLLGTVDQTQQVWKRTTAKVAQFQASRAAFEAMTRRLGQATLNTYWRAQDGNSANSRADFLFRRHSELQFVSGHLNDATGKSGRIPGIFTEQKLTGLTTPTERAYPTHGVFFFAPLGVTEESARTAYPTGTVVKGLTRFRELDGMVTACGYFVEYGDDPNRPLILPRAVVPARKRFRLMELTVPAEQLTIYNRFAPFGSQANDPFGMPWAFSIFPQVADRKKNNYVGRVDENLKTTANWVRPFWMEQALRRTTTDSTTSQNHFAFGRVMADNIVALVVLPKLAEKDRENPTDLGKLAPEYQYDSWRILRKDAASDANAARDNLLPPIVQISMVAIDESSALRLPRNTIPDWTIRDDKQLFTKVSNEAEFLDDMAELEKRLQADKVSYRVFSTDVVIRGSKWSKDPKN